MKIKDYNVELINDDYSEDKAEQDAEKDFFHSVIYEEVSSYYHKSKTNDDVIYAFHCEPRNGWCVLVEKFKIIK